MTVRTRNRIGVFALIANLLGLLAGLLTDHRVPVVFGVVGALIGIWWSVLIIRAARRAPEETR